MKLLASLLLLSSLCFGQTAPRDTVDMIVYNANIVSGPFTPTYKAMVVKDGKIVALYKKNKWEKKYWSATTLDMQKKVVMPGFIDAHCHFLGLGKAMNEVNLYGAKSWNETVERVVAFAKLHPEKKWIQGRGWDQNNWAVKDFPDNKLLDSLLQNKYVVLNRVDGHAVIANTNVLMLAKVTKDSEIAGGKVLLNQGNLTGVLIDKATELVESVIPNPGQQDKINWLLMAQKECLSYGITQVADAGLPIQDILLIDSLCQAGVLKMRYYLMANPGAETRDYFNKNGVLSTDNVKCKSIKIYSDGALGSRGALLKHPYCDDKTNYGLSLIDPVSLDSLLAYIYAKGLQANTHCIGDSANAMVLKAYAKALKTTTNDRRWRIEHAQVVAPEDLTYFQIYSIIPSVQPTHATSDMYWAETRLCSSRMPGAYSYQSLLANSGYILLGTDFPVEYVSPFYTIRSARFRQDAKAFPVGGFNKKEALTAQQTFAGMSIWAATGNFWERQTGTLEIGKFADFMVLGKNPYTASFKDLSGMKVDNVFIGGKEH